MNVPLEDEDSKRLSYLTRATQSDPRNPKIYHERAQLYKAERVKLNNLNQQE